ncbi:MAG: SMC-Scp complex subunit ScpB [Pseudomonadota bacterium]
MDERLRAVEAIIFAAETPILATDIARHVGDDEDIAPLLEELSRHYADRGIRLVRNGELWHFQTASDLAHLLRHEREAVRKLSRAATETLAIIAYHEPVSRAEIESIRGVQTSKGTLDVLMELEWIRPAGRRETPGRPLTYATTPEFLVHFGLSGRRDLPGIADLRAAGLLDPVDVAMEQAMNEMAEDVESEAEVADVGETNTGYDAPLDEYIGQYEDSVAETPENP